MEVALSSRAMKTVDILTGRHVYLRNMDETDATPRYVGWLNDQEINRYLLTKYATVESQRAFIAEKNAKNDATLFGVFLREGGKHIGTTKLEPIDWEAKKATLGMMIGDRQYLKYGLGAETMQMMINFCFNTLGLEEVNLGALAQNAAAVQSYRKLGFVEVKREIGAVHFPNGIFDQVTMVLKK